jgi:hypothetical protein
MTNTQPAGYESRTLNQWIELAKHQPVPRLLFGEFWIEGELAVMFGDTGAGKSLLAVQIAESIARGREIEPFDMDAKPQHVLYFDFELSEKQLELRYTKDHKPGLSSLKRHYRFSERFHRIKVDLNAPLPKGIRNFDEYLIGIIKQHVSETGARVVIIDNVLHMKRSYGSANDAVRLMNALNNLKNTLGLSILLLAHNRKRASSRTLTAGDQISSRLIASLADSVFAIGQTDDDPAWRYIKQLKARSTEMIYDASNIPWFRIAKLGRNFLGLEFQSFEPERTHTPERPDADRTTIDLIKWKKDHGMTIRAIAADLEMSRSTVHRLLRLWKPPVDEDTEQVPYVPDSDDDGWQPLEEEYQGQHTDWALQRMGMRPVWKERLDAVETDIPPDDDGILESYKEEFKSPPHPPANNGLTPQIDGYGREILVESEDSRGRPAVWYQTDRQGMTKRYERQGFLVSVRQAAPMQPPATQ